MGARKATQALARTRIRRLSAAQWTNTVAQGLGAKPTATFPADALSSSTGFNTDSDLNKVNVQLANAYFDTGDTLAPAASSFSLASGERIVKAMN